MIFALLLLANAAGWVPARWPSSDPKSLDLLKNTPVNCLLIEHAYWSGALNTRAKQLNVTPLALVRPGDDPAKALAAGFEGLVFEGEFDRAVVSRWKPVAVLSTRTQMGWNTPEPIAGTWQGLFPGIHVERDGAAKAAPTGAPWVDTNSGFLRFARALTEKPIWIANTPPPKTIYRVERYLQAICDAAISGARWVLAFDEDFWARLMRGESAAVRDWQRIVQLLAHFEKHPEWRNLSPAGQFAVVQDASSGALVSGGVLDMVAARHTPVRPVPSSKLTDERLRGAKLAVDIDPSILTEEQKQVLRRFTAAGGTLLSGPPGWKFPSAQAGSITLSKEDVDKLDAIWREMNAMTGRRNLGARLFNVAGMLSNLLVTADGQGRVLHLVNYSGYPVEDITVHFLGKFGKAILYTPEAEPTELKLFPVEEGTGVEIGRLVITGTVVIQP